MKFAIISSILTASSATATSVLSNRVKTLENEVSNEYLKAVQISCINDEKCDMCKMVANTIQDKAPELTKMAVLIIEGLCSSVFNQPFIHAACESAKEQLDPMLENVLGNIASECDKLPFCQPHNFFNLAFDYKTLCSFSKTDPENNISCQQCLDMTKQLTDVGHKDLSRIETTLSALCKVLGKDKENCQTQMGKAFKSVMDKMDSILKPVCKDELHLCS